MPTVHYWFPPVQRMQLVQGRSRQQANRMLFHRGTLDDTPPTRVTPLTSHGRALWIYLLTPGFTLGYHQHVLGVADITLAKHLGRARAAALVDATLGDDVLANTNSITPADGLLMAQRRGTTHLPFWSRLAIGEMRRNGVGVAEIAELFQCSRETVRIVLSRSSKAFHGFTGERQLNSAQVLPVGGWRRGHSGNPQHLQV